MRKALRREVLGSVIALTAAYFSYRAGIAYLPSILLIIAGVIATGIFADLEDEVVAHLDEPDLGSHDWRLILFRFIRSLALLVLGVLIFVLLALQF